MPSGSQDPENYSIDEMMERLKKKTPSTSEDDGALVTRPDGSQAIRVRKRKRRSKQPIKERQQTDKKRRFAQLLALFILLLLLCGVFAGSVIYSNSRPFRTSLTEKIATTTGASVEMRQFRMNPTSANADTLQLSWPEGNAMESLFVRGLRAETGITSFFGGSFHGEQVAATQGTLTLRTPDRTKPHTLNPLEHGGIDFQRMSIAKLDILPGEGMPRTLTMRNVEASFYPNSGSDSPAQIRFNGGNLRLPGLPDLRLDRSFMEFRGSTMKILAARMLHGTDELGEFLLAGELQPIDENAISTLAAELTNFQIQGIIGDAMSRLIAGRIKSQVRDGSNYLRIPIADPATSRLEISFESAPVSPMRIGGFDFLSELAVLLADPWFEQPIFESQISGEIHRSQGIIEIRNLHAENRSRMAIRGNIRQEANGRLSGKLEIGLSTILVAAAPTPRIASITTESSGGFRWFSLEIGGTTQTPTDNFTSLLDNPPAPPSGGAGGTGGVPSFEDLTRPR